MPVCDLCGGEYQGLTFRVVQHRTAHGFDRIECAEQAHRAVAEVEGHQVSVSARARRVLEQLEQTAAELFATRAELAAERRRRQRLEQEQALLKRT